MRTFPIVALVAAAVLLLQGCDSLVEDTEPSTSVSQEVALTSPDAVNGIRASMYDRMHATALSTDWLLGPSAQADNTFFRGNQQRHIGLNRFGVAPRNGIGTGAYATLYALINDANLLINGIDESVLPQATANKYRAEALFMRALAYHHLTRVFGYDPDGNGGVVSPNTGPGSGFDLGVVIRTEPTLAVEDAVSLPRSTVSEVYDQIESDLETALEAFQSLSEETREETPFYPSAASVYALMARVNLYSRDWDAADENAQNALDAAASLFGSGIASASQLDDIFDENGTNPEAIFTIDTDPIQEALSINDAISAYTSFQWIAQIPTQDLIDLYEEGDARLEAWYTSCYDEINDIDVSNCTTVNNDGLEISKYVAEQGIATYADDYIHFRVAEMVLIQAEARLNTSGAAAAVNRLNDLRENRSVEDFDDDDYDSSVGADGLGSSAEGVYELILNERRREMVAEGHRFFDLKRLGLDIQKAESTGLEDVPFSYYGILDDIPPAQLEVNEELVQNPGYRD